MTVFANPIAAEIDRRASQGQTTDQILRWYRSAYLDGDDDAADGIARVVAQRTGEITGPSLEDARAVLLAGLMGAVRQASESKRWDAVIRGYELLMQVAGVMYGSGDMIERLTREGYCVTVPPEIRGGSSDGSDRQVP